MFRTVQMKVFEAVNHPSLKLYISMLERSEVRD